MKKIACALLMVPLALCLACGAVNIITAFATGEIHLLSWIQDHRVLIAFVLCYLLLTFVGPFKKEK